MNNETVYQNDDIICNEQESAERLQNCQQCENLILNDSGFTQCSVTGCLINLMTTFRFKSCPKGFW